MDQYPTTRKSLLIEMLIQILMEGIVTEYSRLMTTVYSMTSFSEFERDKMADWIRSVVSYVFVQPLFDSKAQHEKCLILVSKDVGFSNTLL